MDVSLRIMKKRREKELACVKSRVMDGLQDSHSHILTLLIDIRCAATENEAVSLSSWFLHTSSEGAYQSEGAAQILSS